MIWKLRVWVLLALAGSTAGKHNDTAKGKAGREFESRAHHDMFSAILFCCFYPMPFSRSFSHEIMPLQLPAIVHFELKPLRLKLIVCELFENCLQLLKIV
jgi:hypothetical protein